MTGYRSKKAAALAKTIDQVNWVDHEPDGLAQPAQEPDWKALVLEHNADCDSLCDMDECGYKEYFEFSNRRCPTCPVKQKIDVNYATQPQQRPWAGLTEEEQSALVLKYGDTPVALCLETERKLKEQNT
jgi:hypothetical protein